MCDITHTHYITNTNYKFETSIVIYIFFTKENNKFKDLMRSKNTSGYFSFYVDNISIKHIPLEIFQQFPLNPD